LAAWKACGSDVVPPASVLAMPKLPIKVDASKTNGAISEREGEKWAVAYLREQNIELWAGTTNRAAILSGRCLGPPGSYDNLFATEVDNIHKAMTAGGHIEINPIATLVSLSIVPAPPHAQDYAFTLSGRRPQYALVVTYQGPLASYIVDDSGKRLQTLGTTPAGVRFSDANFGEYANSPIGPIWFQLAADDCNSAWVAGTCSA
jgi:hypothetical protein